MTDEDALEEIHRLALEWAASHVDNGHDEATADAMALILFLSSPYQSDRQPPEKQF